MKKSDLRSGMFVRTRSNEVYMVVGNSLVTVSRGISLDRYSDDLVDHTDRAGTIDGVFEVIDDLIVGKGLFDIILDFQKFASPIWERATVEMTSSEMIDYIKMLTGQTVVELVEIIDNPEFDIDDEDIII